MTVERSKRRSLVALTFIAKSTYAMLEIQISVSLIDRQLKPYFDFMKNVSPVQAVEFPNKVMAVSYPDQPCLSNQPPGLND